MIAWTRAIVLLVCAAAVSACSGTSLPFSKSGATTPTGLASPPVAVRSITGLPEEKAAALVDALVVAAARRDIAIVRNEAEGAFVLAGQFQLRQTDAGTAVGYYWTVADRDRRLLHEIADTEAARPGGQDPWAGVDEDVLARIAAYTAERLSSRFSRLGFATSIAGLPPPVDHMVKAGPDAEQDIDFETLYGPNALPDVDPAIAATDPPLPMQADATPEQADPAPRSRSDDGDAANSIRAVAIAGVSGASGAGNGELSTALARVLSRAGWPVEDRPGKDTLAIHGDISIGEPRGKVQKVALRWTVTAPDGEVLGTIEQANDVPSGSLDEGWGEAADYAAQAAAEGIFDLVNRLR